MPHHQVRCGPCRLPRTEHPKVNGRDHFVREAGIRAHGRDRRMPPANGDVLHLRQQPTVPVTQLKKPHDDEVTGEPLTKLKPWHYYQNHRSIRPIDRGGGEPHHDDPYPTTTPAHQHTDNKRTGAATATQQHRASLRVLGPAL